MELKKKPFNDICVYLLLTDPLLPGLFYNHLCHSLIQSVSKWAFSSKASHWPWDHITSSRPLIGQPPLTPLFSWTKSWSYLVEGLLSLGPTPSSFHTGTYRILFFFKFNKDWQSFEYLCIKHSLKEKHSLMWIVNFYFMWRQNLILNRSESQANFQYKQEWKPSV